MSAPRERRPNRASFEGYASVYEARENRSYSRPYGKEYVAPCGCIVPVAVRDPWRGYPEGFPTPCPRHRPECKFIENIAPDASINDALRRVYAWVTALRAGEYGIVAKAQHMFVCVPVSRCTDAQTYYVCPFCRTRMNRDGIWSKASKPTVHLHGGHGGDNRYIRLGLQGTKGTHCRFMEFGDGVYASMALFVTPATEIVVRGRSTEPLPMA